MKIHLRRYLFIFLSFVVVTGCKKDGKSNDTKTLPEVKTVEITALSPTKALIKAHIVNKGNIAVSDFGFVYSSSLINLNVNKGIKISLGSNLPDGDFSKEVDGLILPVTDNMIPTLYAKAYIITASGNVFGEVLSTLMTTPATGDITPKSGMAGDTITIAGLFYKGSTDVTFGSNNVEAKIIDQSDAKIKVIIPSGISAMHNTNIPIQITSAGQKITPITDFTIFAHITDFTPKSGPLGIAINFTGDNMPDEASLNKSIKVFIDNIDTHLYLSGGPLSSGMPFNVTKNSVKLEVEINSAKKYSIPGEYTVLPPVINSITPTSGLIGAHVLVSGSNLPFLYNFQDYPIVKIGNVPIPGGERGDGKTIGFDVPAGMAPGIYSFTMMVGPNTVVASQKFTVLSPTVTGFSPSSGTHGNAVDIQGIFLENEYYEVSFGSSSYFIQCKSPNSIRVYVPSDIHPGIVKLSLKLNNVNVVVTDKIKPWIL
jgi:hypothetical protein